MRVLQSLLAVVMLVPVSTLVLVQGCSNADVQCCQDSDGNCNCTGGGQCSSSEKAVSSCSAAPGQSCCVLGTLGDVNYSCACKVSSSNCNCSPPSAAWCMTQRQAQGCAPSTVHGSSGASGGGCYQPNWESDCTNSTECDAGLTCNAACPSCSSRCNSASCSSDADCQAAYGNLTKNGKPYCAATCNSSSGRCEF